MRRPEACPVLSPPPSGFWPTLFASSVSSHLSSSPAVRGSPPRRRPPASRPCSAPPSRRVTSAVPSSAAPPACGRRDRPLLSLSTSYCGSSVDASTVRPAAFLRSVISRLTVPLTVLPWLFHVTSSPVCSFLRRAIALTSPVPGSIDFLACSPICPLRSFREVRRRGTRAGRLGHGGRPHARARAPGARGAHAATRAAARRPGGHAPRQPDRDAPPPAPPAPACLARPPDPGRTEPAYSAPPRSDAGQTYRGRPAHREQLRVELRVLRSSADWWLV